MEPHLSQAATDHQIELAIAIKVADCGVERPARALFVRKGGDMQLDWLTKLSGPFHN
jgi:hypothetical protein